MVKNPHVIAGLKDELSTLKAELSANPLFQRIQRIEEFLRFYEGDQPPKPVAPTPSLFPLPVKSVPTQREQIIGAVREIIKASGGVAKRSHILAQLVAAGLIKTKKPIKTLAPILSETPEFVSDGKGSWRIASPSGPPQPQSSEVKKETRSWLDDQPRAPAH